MNALRRSTAALLLALLTACGGGGGSSDSVDTTPLPPLAAGESAYDDPVAYSAAADGSIAGAVEAAAVTKHTLGSIAYTARAGHLIARRPGDGAAEASMFYVAYSADGADAATRPVTFFYNGGPGSATVWLHLGSFGPRRLATGVPSTAAAAPFALVDNAESLLDTTDLVFVDAVGTGLSTAIAPFKNSAFWGVDADAALFRDFIVRWLSANGRGASPLVLYGESYGGPRTAVLARALGDAGVRVDALVLQSPALDYNSNCDIAGTATGCSSDLPSYGAIGAFHARTNPLPNDLDAYMATLRSFTAERYAPAVGAVLQGAAVPADLPPLLAGYTGIAAPLWQQQFNLFPDTFRLNVVPGSIVGRYDGRMAAVQGSALAADGDPSLTFIESSFETGIANLLRTLRYTNASNYVMLGSAIASWNFGHAGRPLPDTVPDLAAALAANPALRVLAMSGYHDLATPFRTTELDLARLGSDPRVQVRNYPGGHMSYLDDATRARQKADLVAFYGGALAGAARRGGHAQVLAAKPGADRAGNVPAVRETPLVQPSIQTPLRDPAVPPIPRR